MFRDPALLPDPFPDVLRPIAWAAPRDHLALMRLRRGLAAAEFVVGVPYRLSYRMVGEVRARIVEVPAGFVTDLSTVPWPLRMLIGPVGRHLEAAVVHDYMVLHSDGAGETARRRFADGLMLAQMTEAECWLRWPIYVALRLAGSRRPTRVDRAVIAEVPAATCRA
ncbi:DUF1353 domain-containing protein [Algicella marina]|uniref:DUF1353 domain-containing protein n=1 Tax=Algicella marina TaxID=2683284 RepID=A0A6P1T265_9RHOB|nr:DUF1353 domain-containing protein [Algicella marina]QHQ35821.1 DUF1353 domain-containing protein [Algicella marina]